MSGSLAKVVEVIERAGLDYRMTAFGTLVEGSWDDLVSLAKKCHFEVRKDSERVLTMMRVDDYGDRTGEIDGAVNRVEQKLGRAIKK